MNRHPFTHKSNRGGTRSPHHGSIQPVAVTQSDHGLPNSGLRLSSRGLDICLLAMCSCALSLMCHHAPGLTNLPSITSTSATHSGAGSAAQVDFVIKAGLITSRQDSGGDKQDDGA